MNDERVLIVGTGTMACVFAGLLAERSEVLLLGTWPEGIQTVNDSGIRLLTDGGERTIRVPATDDPRACLGVRQALVLVKSWQTAGAAAQLKLCLAQEGVALSLQNGLGNWEALRMALGDGRAAAGVTRMGATLLAPGVVRLGGRGPTTLGPHPRLGPLQRRLQSAGLDVERVDDLEGVLWGKLAVNAAINPVAALLRLAAFFGLAGELRTSRLPDLTQYRVRIEDHGRGSEVCVDDACTDTALLELAERVAEASKAAAG